MVEMPKAPIHMFSRDKKSRHRAPSQSNRRNSNGRDKLNNSPQSSTLGDTASAAVVVSRLLCRTCGGAADDALPKQCSRGSAFQRYGGDGRCSGASGQTAPQPPPSFGEEASEWPLPHLVTQTSTRRRP